MPFSPYKPVQTNQIRLLRLLPGPKDAPLRASIKHVDLSAASGTFEALSYAWEGSKKMRILQTNIGNLGLTLSLYRALRRLRSAEKTRILWVDAVCINQKDEIEKGLQVRLMSTIYGTASKVTVYLGVERDGSTEALELLEKISATDFYARGITTFMRDDQLEDVGLPCPGNRVWASLRKFWCRPWFRRVWVLQEFVFGGELTIACGEWEKDWNVLRHAASKSMRSGLTCRGYQIGMDAQEFHDAYSGCMAFIQTARMRSGAQGFMSVPFIMLHRDFERMFIDNLQSEIPEDSEASEEIMAYLKPAWNNKRAQGDFLGFAEWKLLDLIQQTSSCKATDERDRLYALLSLADDTEDPDLGPDYTISLSLVLRRYTAAFIRKGRCMDLLPLAGVGSQPYGCPSWVPYFTRPSSELTKLYVPFAATNFYSAAGESKEEVRVFEESDTLIVKGGRFDRIWFIGRDASTMTGAGQATPFMLGAHIGYALSVFATLSNYPTGQPMEEVVWRTLIGNRTVDLSEAPANYGDEFKKWITQVLTPQEKSGYATYQNMAEFLWYSAGQPYASSFLISYLQRRICMTDKGYVGLAPQNADVGDYIYVLNGGKVPYVLRSSRDRSGAMHLVGEAYIHGIMNGEAMVAENRTETDIAMH